MESSAEVPSKRETRTGSWLYDGAPIVHHVASEGNIGGRLLSEIETDHVAVGLTHFVASDGQNRARNVGTVSFCCGEPGSSDMLVTYAGLCAASAIGAPGNGRAKQARPLSSVAWPGATVRVVNAGRLTAAPGALVFQL